MAAAATQPPAPPGLFTFLRHGVVFPPRIGRGLFLPLLALTAALTVAFLFPFPGSFTMTLDGDAISLTDPRSVAYPALVESIRGELRRLLRDIGMVLLLLAVAVGSSRVKLFMLVVLATTVLSSVLHLFQCLVLAARAGIYTDNVSVPYLVAATVGSATYIATVFAAVASRSSGAGASPSSSFLRMVRGNNLLRPVLTTALGGALKLACGALVAFNPLPASVLDKVVIFIALLLYACVEFVFRLAVVASVEEPERCRGAGAARRAWRLMRRGKCEQAQSYLLQQWILDSQFRLVHTLVLAIAKWLQGAAIGEVVQVDATVMCLLLMAEEMLTVAKTTAYYFECRKMEEEEENKAGHGD